MSISVYPTCLMVVRNNPRDEKYCIDWMMHKFSLKRSSAYIYYRKAVKQIAKESGEYNGTSKVIVRGIDIDSNIDKTNRDIKDTVDFIKSVSGIFPSPLSMSLAIANKGSSISVRVDMDNRIELEKKMDAYLGSMFNDTTMSISDIKVKFLSKYPGEDDHFESFVSEYQT